MIKYEPRKVCPSCGGLYPEWFVAGVHDVSELRGRFWRAHRPGCPVAAGGHLHEELERQNFFQTPAGQPIIEVQRT